MASRRAVTVGTQCRKSQLTAARDLHGLATRKRIVSTPLDAMYENPTQLGNVNNAWPGSTDLSDEDGDQYSTSTAKSIGPSVHCSALLN